MGDIRGGQLPPLHIVSHGISDVSAGPVVGGYYTVLNTLKRKQKQLKDLANYLKYFCSVEQCSQSKTYLLISSTQWPIRNVRVFRIHSPLKEPEFCTLVNHLMTKCRRDVNKRFIV